MAEGKLRRYARFHKDAVMSGGTKGVALAGSVSLVLGGSVGALTVWLADVSWVIAALVATASLFFFYAWGAYRVWDGADRGRQQAAAELATECAKAPPPVPQGVTFWDAPGATLAGNEITNTYNAPAEGAGPGGRLIAMGPGTSITDGMVRVHYGKSAPLALPDPFPSTPDERIMLRDQLLALAGQVDAVMAPWELSTVDIARQMGITEHEEFMARITEIKSEMSRIGDEATQQYNDDCRSAVIQAYGHARSIGFADAEMEEDWRTRHGAGASSIPALLRRIAARIPGLAA